MKEFTVKQKDTLKKFTDNTYPQGSFYFDSLLKKKDIRINGVKVGKDLPLEEGDVVAYYTTAAQEAKEAFYVLFEDENVIVVDKESGVNSEAVFYTLSSGGECYFIHRLDRNTCGVMIFARNRSAEEELLAFFRGKNVTKIYHALCVSNFPEEKGILTAYLQKNAENSFVKIYDEPKKGEKIVTEYRIMERYKDICLTEITLHTGKTHQIRAHLAHIGCPVLGDMKYGNKEYNKKYNRTRQCLIAKHLQIHAEGCLSYLNGKIFSSRFDFSATVR